MGRRKAPLDHNSDTIGSGPAPSLFALAEVKLDAATACDMLRLVIGSRTVLPHHEARLRAESARPGRSSAVALLRPGPSEPAGLRPPPAGGEKISCWGFNLEVGFEQISKNH